MNNLESVSCGFEENKKNLEVCFRFWPILNLKVPKSKAGHTPAIGVVVPGLSEPAFVCLFFHLLKTDQGP